MSDESLDCFAVIELFGHQRVVSPRYVPKKGVV